MCQLRFKRFILGIDIQIWSFVLFSIDIQSVTLTRGNNTHVCMSDSIEVTCLATVVVSSIKNSWLRQSFMWSNQITSKYNITLYVKTNM